MTDQELIEYRIKWTCYYKQMEFGRKSILHNLKLAINKKISAISRSTPPEEKDEVFWQRMRDIRADYLRVHWQTCGESNKRLGRYQK